MLFHDLVRTSGQVAADPSRLRKIEHLSAFLKSLAPDEVPAAVAFLSGDVRQGRIGLGYAAVRDARPAASAAKPTLTIRDVDEAFGRMAGLSGPGSARARLAAFVDLLGRADPAGQDFLQRLVLGELRQGAQEGVIIDAIARAAGVSRASVQRAWMLAGDAGAVARAALRDGERGLATFHLRVFQPLQPMLAQTAADEAEVLGKLGTAAFEFKMDGARIQVHRSGGDVRVFTRSLNDVTAAVPEVAEAVRAMPAREIILDGEAVVRREDGRPAPFQVTMRRFGRKSDVEAMRRDLPIAPYFFDLLRLDDADLIDRPSRERFEALRRTAPDAAVMPRIETDAPDEARAFIDRSLAAGNEGVVAKAVDSLYEAGRRGAQWLKVKPAHTLDLVVLAAEWGSGRRKGRLSNIHLGARDPKLGFVMLGKTFKGMTDEMLEWQTRRFLELEARREDYVIYLRPEQVVEIAFDGVQESPQYPGGLALRFARVKRYRDDKTAAEADTLDMVRAIYIRHKGQVP